MSKVFLRAAITIVSLLALTGCMSDKETYGKGPLVLSPAAFNSFERLLTGDLKTGLYLAIHPRGGNAAWGFCREGQGQCAGGVTTAGVLHNCNQRGDGCAIMVADDQIVWQGPIFGLHEPTSQAVPYHGEWAMPVASGGTARLIADRGEMQLHLPGHTVHCAFDLFPSGGTIGTWSVVCPDGNRGRGDYVYRKANAELKGTGEFGGEPLQFSLPLRKGGPPRVS